MNIEVTCWCGSDLDEYGRCKADEHPVEVHSESAANLGHDELLHHLDSTERNDR